jgi:hypothetical protein
MKLPNTPRELDTGFASPYQGASTVGWQLLQIRKFHSGIRHCKNPDCLLVKLKHSC